MTAWIPTIGLECHAQLRTRSKMFCACPVVAEAPANSAVCPICLGHPGALPALNGEALRLAVRAGQALGCEVHPVSIFARKHYFYPDLPKGYQVSQYDRPLCTGGSVHALVGGELRRWGLTRIHMEEDAGRMHHSTGGSTVDWNRGGVPLIEIVGQPDLHSAEEAEAWLRALHRVLVEAGICGGDMEKGQLRCDANVSVGPVGGPLGTRVELKNINSFRFVARALRHEIERQIALLEAGQRVAPETRTWNGQQTVLLRSKETAADYRYFPEPDLPALVLSAEELAPQALPGRPLDLHLIEEDRRSLRDLCDRHGLSDADGGVLLGEPRARAFFEAAVAAGGERRAMCTWTVGELLRRINERGDLGQLRPEALVRLQALVDGGTLNRAMARELLEELVQAGGDPESLAAARGLSQVGDEEALRAVARGVIAGAPGQLAKWKAGNKGMLGFFMGQVMKAFGGRANPALCNRIVLEELEAA